MPIIYHEKQKVFHLFNQQLSYIFMVLKNGQLGQLYYGNHIQDQEDFTPMLELYPRAMSACPYPEDLAFSMEHIKQEYPSYGHGDMHYPAYEILQENGSRITNFTYVSHNIMAGKPKLNALPATYVEQEEEATTLELYLHDEVIHCDLTLSYSIYEDLAVLTRNANFISHHQETITLSKAMSACVDLPDASYEMVELTGAWSRERHVQQRTLQHGVQSIHSMRGASSNNYNPFIALKRKDCGEVSGEVYGFSFVYSGNFLASVEVDTYDATRVLMGIHPQSFSWPLSNGESFQTPEVVMVYSNHGMNAMSQTYHTLYQNRLVRGKWRNQPRPILINNWEATYFDFHQERLLALAKEAKKLGIELFVLDDGWFKNRNDDTTSLGDWTPDTKKLPQGITGLAKQIESLGMSFGLWFEPEMLSIDSDLYRTHPEWMLSTPNRKPSHGRHQFVLDFSNQDVVDHLFKQMYTILSQASISYIKWDMNRCMSEVYSQSHDALYQGCVMHSYILGVYNLYERLIEAFPHILFESCASGGARCDPGMLYYAPQCWASDNTDAIERLKIQYGTSFVYPISSIGSHVSTIPNHQMLRNTPLDTRANVAYFGTFGYELDLLKLEANEKELIMKQIQFMKTHRSILQFGSFYRLVSPFTSNHSAWMVVSQDKQCAIVGYYRVLQKVNSAYERIPLQGLLPSVKYHNSLTERAVYGDELMNFGLITSDASCGEQKEEYDGTNGDFISRIYILKAI